MRYVYELTALMALVGCSAKSNIHLYSTYMGRRGDGVGHL